MSRAERHINKPTTALSPRSQPQLRLSWVLVVVLATALYGAVAHGHGKATTAQPVPPASSQATQADAALDQLITSWAKQHTFGSSVAVIELTGQKRASSYHDTTSIVPGSMYKLYVAYAVLHDVEQGQYGLQSHTDSSHTITADLSTMIINSDNDAARRLGFMVGWKNIDTLLKVQGLTHTNLYNYSPPSTAPVGDKHTTAADLATFLQKLQAGTLLRPTNNNLLLGLMKKQSYVNYIAAGVPNNVMVADKPGWLTPADGINEYVENDAGIVYGPKSTYVLVVTTTGSTTKPITDLSHQVYNYLEQ